MLEVNQLEALLSQITTFFLDIVGRLGYLGVFFALFLEGMWFPISSDSVLLLAGFLAFKGQLNAFLIAIAAAFGFTMGSLIPYGIVRAGGRQIVYRYGRWVGVGPDRLAQGERWFSRYGLAILILSRLLPVVRAVMTVPAGLARVSLSTYILATFWGYLPWGLAITLLGGKVGQNWARIEKAFERIDAWLLLLIGLLVLSLYILIRVRSMKRGPAPE